MSISHLNIGDKTPTFTAQNENDETISSESLKGQKYILFFYPKDDSPGCTKEACSLRDQYKIFKKNGYTILGVSPDNVKKHKKFIDKYEFQYSLLADPEKEVINAFGVWGTKKFMGREIIGVHRTTFVMDENGVITNILSKVKTKEHADQLINELSLS